MKTYRYLIPIALVALLLVQLASAMHLFGWHDTGGQAAAGRDVTGRWTIVYVDPGRADASGPALGHLAGALDRLGPDASRVAPIFIARDAGAASVDPRIARLVGTPAAIQQAEAGDGGAGAPHEAGLFVIRRPNGSFAETIDGAADAQVIADRLRALIG